MLLWASTLSSCLLVFDQMVSNGVSNRVSNGGVEWLSFILINAFVMWLFVRSFGEQIQNIRVEEQRNSWRWLIRLGQKVISKWRGFESLGMGWNGQAIISHTIYIHICVCVCECVCVCVCGCMCVCVCVLEEREKVMEKERKKERKKEKETAVRKKERVRGRRRNRKGGHEKEENSLVWFYGISNIVGYLMQNSIFTYILDINDL